MFSTLDSTILFYLSISCVVGVGLFFSRSMDIDADHYYQGGLANAGGKSGYSVFLFALLTGVIILLPSLSLLSVSRWFILLAGLSIAAPLLLAGYHIAPFSQSHFKHIPAVRIFVEMVVLIFLLSVQLLVVIQISDFIISQFYGGSHYTILSIMIVAGGIYTMAGGFVAVTYASMTVSVFTMLSIVAVLINDAFLNMPLLFSFRTLFSFGSDLFQSAGLSEHNGVITIAGVFFMMLWMTWTNIDAIRSGVAPETTRRWGKNLVVIGCIVGLTISLMVYGAVSFGKGVPGSMIIVPGSIDHAIGIGLLMGCMGILAQVFQKIGLIVAVRVYPLVRGTVGDEEKILVGRMTTVVVVLLSILFISVSEISKYQAMLWYINYIVFFFTPLTATALVAAIVKRRTELMCIGGIVVGEMYAMVSAVRFYGGSESSIFGSVSPYAFVIDILMVTVIAGILTAWLSEAAVVQKAVTKIRLFVIR